MIPIRLSVHNFMCYRDNVPPLSFEGIHIACVCGDNGNGKSALLDAMTWGLWGEARAKSDDDLVHQGLTEMAVEFDFAVGEQRYRVLRRHAVPRKPGQPGQTVLHFELVSPEGSKVLDGNTISQTQKEINRILRMDYETFKNSAFLLQGHADAFTVKRPADRKQLLADILGLGFYDDLEERARNLRKQREAEAQELDRSITGIDVELSHKAAYQAELDSIKGTLLRLGEQIGQKQAFLIACRKRKEELEYKKSQLLQIESEMAQAAREQESWAKRAREHRAKVAEYEGILEQRQEIEAGYQRLVAARKVKDDQDVKSRLLHDIKESKRQAERAVEKAEAGLAGERNLILSRVQELEGRAGRLTHLQAELVRSKAKLVELEERETGEETKKRQAQELSAQVRSVEDRALRLQGEVKELEEKLDLLSRGDACCPLCERALEPGSRQLIEDKYKVQRQASIKEADACQKQLDKNRLGLKALEVEIARQGERLRQERDGLQSQISLCGKGIAEAQQAQAELPAQRDKAANIQERLARGDFAHAERDRLREMTAQEQALAYDPGQHRQAQETVDKLKQYEEMKRRVDDAEGLLSQEKSALLEAEKVAGDRQVAMEREKQRHRGLSRDVAALPGLLTELGEREPELHRLVDSEAEENKRLGATQEKLRRCQELEAAREEKINLLRHAADQELVYRELAEAFGKKGIQALLIESALPEIEAEANSLLGRMTDNRMHVKLESQRETKKGSVQETLDIKVSDELGTRDYELFSGGEAFRINFALRIALSKLLARRAGAPLPTLIIDEGFGTQDSSGRERLVEAISSIQDDFQKILVITHIDELKSAFPVRIDVIKTAEGSTFSVAS